MTVWNCPCVNSAIGLCALGSRNMLFGVITTSGLRKLRFICRRNTWNICAVVEGYTT